jgi:predicted phage-related endonuclease
MKHFRIPKPAHGSQAWLEARWKNAEGLPQIAASAAAAVHGEHKFISTTDLAIELMAETPPEPKPTTSAMMRGTTLEPAIREWAEYTLKKALVEPAELYCYEEDGVRLVATIDSMDADGNVYEQKTSNKMWRGELPRYWYWQGVQQAICCDVPEITWVIFDSTLDLHFDKQTVTSDEKQVHIQAVRTFLSFIDMGILPPDAQATYENMSTLYPKGEGGADAAKELSQAAVDAVRALKTVKKELSVLEKREDELKALICAELGTSEYGLLNDDLLVSWKTSTRKSFDLKKFEADHPALVQKYQKETTVRTLRTTGKE